jgi:nitrous oxidase accessory protein NosD
MASSRVKGIRPITLLFALAVLICVMLIAPAAADTLPDRVYVNASYDNSTPDYGVLNFSTIQSAIDGVADGGEVWVYNGTYNEAIVIDRSMNVTTVSGLNGTTIDALCEPAGVEITASNVSFYGFEVVNASAAGIYAHGADAVTIEHNSVTVLNDTYEETCGIYVVDGEGACISNNTARVVGSSGQAGIMVERVTEACIHDNLAQAFSRYPAPVFIPLVANPVGASLVTDEDKSFLTTEAEVRMMEPNAVLIVNSTAVAVENNQSCPRVSAPQTNSLRTTRSSTPGASGPTTRRT